MHIPIISDNDYTTDYEYYNFNFEESAEVEALKARKYFKDRPTYSIQKYLVTTEFNPNLYSGLNIYLKIAVASNTKNYEYSPYQSGNYIIEDCIHTWNENNSKKGHTYLVVSRKYINVTDFYFCLFDCPPT